MRGAALRRWAGRAKRLLLRSYWRLCWKRLENPVPRERPRSLLFVCKGNICRSPFAEALTTAMLRRADVNGITVDSAGLVPSRDGRAPLEAVRTGSTFGIELQGHTPRGLAAEDGERFDMIVVMEPSQRSEIRRRFPAWRDRTFLLALFEEGPETPPGGEARVTIPDPYGKPPEAFRACFARIERCVEGLLHTVGLRAAGRGPSGTKTNR